MLHDVVYLSIFWLGYFTVHSSLASESVKRWIARMWPRGTRYYRLLFNVIALLLLIPPGLFLFTHESQSLWQWSGVLKVVQTAIAVIVLLGFYWTSKSYNMQEFWGTRQVDDQVESGLCLSFMHRYVRHPWYSLALLYLWSRDMDGLYLTSVILMTLYFWFGSLLEEKKLVNIYGEAYASYRKLVPGLLPVPGKSLTANQLLEIQNMQKEKARGGAGL